MCPSSACLTSDSVFFGNHAKFYSLAKDSSGRSFEEPYLEANLNVWAKIGKAKLIANPSSG
jgi:hypothetical protein